MSELSIKEQEWKKLYNELTPENRQQLLRALRNPTKFNEIYRQTEAIFFVKPPPTPEEFLDPENGWLPRSLLEKLFPNVREDFLTITNPANSKYKNVIEYGSTRRGKSVLLRMIVVYTIVHLHFLRDIHDYFDIPTTPAIFLLSFKLKTAQSLLMKPIYDLLRGAPRFVRVHSQAKVYTEQQKYGYDKIVWSSAAESGEITLTSGLQILLGSSYLDLIGSDIFMLLITELAYFIEKDGATEEEIFQLYTDGAARIGATFPDNPHLSFVYLDTSANNSESVIENYILNTLRHEPTTLFRTGRQWDVYPEKRAPEWLRTGETFTVVSGNGKYPAKLDPTPEELAEIPKDLVHEVPIDYRKRFEENLTKSIKDILGVPTSSESKFIQNGKIVEQIFDNHSLQNEIALIKADSSVNPDKYLWNLLCDKYFTKYDNINWQIKRAPKEPRYIGGDLAFSKSGDLASLCVGHWEWSRVENCKLFVYDFTLAIGPGENGINMAAIRQLILDMGEIGHLPIAGIAFDTFQSEDTSQMLKRRNYNFIKQSVDSTTAPYEFMLSSLLSNTIKAGKNIFLKNNLLNLEKISMTGKRGGEKIDHPLGKTNNIYNGDWDKSNCGYYAKDVSDAATQALFLAYTEAKDYQPQTIYEKENTRLSVSIDRDQKEMESLLKEYAEKFNRRFVF